MSNGMALSAGTRIGPYEIVGLLGAGGMGEVYRARDTKLNREVAIKVLLAAVANDAERLARFSREAQLLASINHPNIAQIYGLEDAGDVRALVMELVEGPTLADRIAHQAIPLEEALPIARQIAEALEAAHELGIIHRDLKPANIKLRADGTVKVLDFGLAKALDPAGATSGEAANSPTLSMQATAAGVILGTAAYMAPEQARGRAVDKRADIWAFGCVLFEMLTGSRAFQGDDITDTIVAVVSKEPEWKALPASASGVRSLLGRCLKKDRRQRLQAIGDARIQIDELISGTSEDVLATRAAIPSRRATPGAIAALAVGAAIAAVATWALTKPAPPAPQQLSRFEIVPPPAQSLNTGSDRDIAISPDGRHIVYRSGAGGGASGGAQLIVRTIDRVGVQTLSGIANARQPFFSSDSQWIGFFEGGTLKKMSITGGAAIPICETPALSRGASWGDHNSIVFGTTDASSGLFEVSAGGGEPNQLTWPDKAKGETNHWYPSVLPDGRGVLFTITARNAAATAQVAVLDSRTGKHKTLTRGSQAEYVEGGHLLYSVTGTLHAVRFDLERLELLGDPMPVVDGVWTAGGGAANYGVSRAGTLVYVPAAAAGTPTLRSLVWVDRTGLETPIPSPPRAYEAPHLSPDGTRVALTIGEPDDSDIYIWDLAREGPLRRLTFDPGIDASPVWTPNGQRIVFRSGGEGLAENLFTRAADGSGTAERLTTSQNFQTPSFITPDGADIVGYEMSAKTAFDIMWFPLKGAASRPLIRTMSIESNPELSADGRYIAYQSNESGRYEIYVRRFPEVDAGGRWQASSGGGTRPVWARNGQELFYLDLENTLTAVPVQTSGGTFAFGRPAKVLDTAYAEALVSSRPYDVSADGQRFLMIKENLTADRAAPPGGFVVVLNWFEEMKAKLPAGR